jgi:hypothetical protein
MKRKTAFRLMLLVFTNWPLVIRFALFFLTILYMPIARLMLQYYRTCGASDATCLQTGYVPPSSVAAVPIVWWILLPFALLYIISVPLFFSNLIRRGVRQIDLNYGIKGELEALHDEELTLKRLKGTDEYKEARVALRKHRAEFAASFAIRAQEHEAAASYLYSSYK